MKILAITLAALVLVAGAAVPMALAQGQQQDSSQQAAPQQQAPAPADKAPAVKAPDTKVDVDIKTGKDRSDDAAGSASPRTGGAERTGFFGLSPTAAIIVSVAVLLVVVLAIVAMTNSRGTTYIDRDRL
jgi:flagellar basal body-associated protein FliL